jgi:hypothetical protein
MLVIYICDKHLPGHVIQGPYFVQQLLYITFFPKSVVYVDSQLSGLH